MSSVLDKIRWFDPSKYDIGGAYLQGQRFNEERKQAEFNRQMAEDKRAELMRQKQLEAEKAQELFSQKATLQMGDRLRGLVDRAGPGMDENLWRSAYEQERSKMATAYPDVAAQLPDYIPPDQIGHLMQGLRSQVGENIDQKQFTGDQRAAAVRYAADRGDMTLANPAFAMKDPEFGSYHDYEVEGRPLMLRRAGKPETNITVGTGEVGLTKANTDRQQEQLLAGREGVRTMNSLLRSMPGKEAFGVSGAIDEARARADDVIGTEGGDFAARHAQIDEWRKGTAAAIQDMVNRMLVKGAVSDHDAERIDKIATNLMVDTSAGHQQVQSSLNAINSILVRRAESARRSLSDPIDLNEPVTAYRPDEASSSSSAGKPDAEGIVAAARTEGRRLARQYKDQGMTPEQIKAAVRRDLLANPRFRDVVR